MILDFIKILIFLWETILGLFLIIGYGGFIVVLAVVIASVIKTLLPNAPNKTLWGLALIPSCLFVYMIALTYRNGGGI